MYSLLCTQIVLQLVEIALDNGSEHHSFTDFGMWVFTSSIYMNTSHHAAQSVESTAFRSLYQSRYGF